MVSLADIREARERVAPVIRDTPMLRSDSLSSLLGRPVWCKGEHLQRTGSFKIRGAYNLISRLDPGVDVVAASAGNHAQGVALAANLTGRRSTIFMPVNAPLPKLDATRGYGADVQLTGSVVDECIEAAQAFAAERGAIFVPPFDDPLIVAGQGTIGLEIAEALPDAEVVIVPIGGGGLIAGIAAALAYTRRSVRVIGVEPEGAASMAAAIAKSDPVMLDSVDTMADGVAVKSVSKLTLAHVQAYVDEVVTVSEEEISRALLLLLERQKALVEPAGASALAALLAGKIGGTGTAVALLSGGNVDPLLLIRLIDHGLSVAGRYVILRIVLRDHPGALAGLTAAVAEMGLNVL
ncbi:MAG: threonine ammonia-lyase, partial [Acidimicrobiia bacterium]